MRINNNKKVQLGVSLPMTLMDRVEAVLDSPVSGHRSKRQFVEIALLKYLESVEPVVAKLEKELLIIRGLRECDNKQSFS